MLVMRFRNPVFPPRCMKTNQSCDPMTTPVSAEGMQSMTVDIPVSSQWLSERKRRTRPGWLLLAGGMFCLVLAALSSGIDLTVNWVIYLTTAGAALAIMGVVYFFMVDRPVATFKKMTTEHVWLGRIHPEFLSSHPEWPGDSRK
ncbi:MAG: hypothetical protein L0922_08210 [Candidatus Mariimomonas ferrooxydans]